eukprot:GHVS01030402.1.p1 GENE.GHVS01030402.1~~GHVS01030402.1.p1  ORF type:complete len:599 (+),score=103.82 GHVS01030402.1:110-1906(+)
MSSCCCGDVVDDAEESIWASRRRLEEVKHSLKTIKGLSRALTFDVGVEAVVDRIAIEQPSLAVIPSGPCTFGLRRGALSCALGLLMWLLLYAAVMVGLHLQLEKLISNQTLEELAGQYLQQEDISIYFHSFHWFFSLATGVTMIVMTIAFCIARVLLGLQILTLSNEVVEGVKEEYQSEFIESINTDFYEYIKRINKYVVVGEEFTKNEMKKIHRKLNLSLTEFCQLLSYQHRDSHGIRSAVEYKVANRRTWLSIIFFMIPCALNVVANCTLIYYVFDLRFRQNHAIESYDYGTLSVNPQAALHSEGFRLIASALCLNCVCWLYLCIVMSGSVVYCMLKCLYSRIHTAAVAFTNRVMHRIWQDVVVEGITPFIEETRPSLLFIDPTDVHTPSPPFPPLSPTPKSHKYALITNDYSTLSTAPTSPAPCHPSQQPRMYSSPPVYPSSPQPSPQMYTSSQPPVCPSSQPQMYSSQPPVYPSSQPQMYSSPHQPSPHVYFAPPLSSAPPCAFYPRQPHHQTDWDEGSSEVNRVVSVPVYRSSPPVTRASTATTKTQEEGPSPRETENNKSPLLSASPRQTENNTLIEMREKTSTAEEGVNGG